MNFETISAYTASFQEDDHPLFKEMEIGAHDRNIPIIQQNGIQFIQFLIGLEKPKRILEIGTAIGYSALKMATASEMVKEIITLERDTEMAEEARKNISQLGYEAKINVIQEDALHLEMDKLNPMDRFDLIFIDAAKGQYRKFFEKFSPLLNNKGLIITDNILFRGIAAEWKETDSKRLARIGKKVDDFNQWLSQQKGYETIFLTIGDGIAITRKKV